MAVIMRHLACVLGIALFGADFTEARHVTSTLTVTNGGGWGIWHREHMCPPASFASGFEVRVERPIDGDDTAGNAVRLYCKTRSNQYMATVYSFNGIWGGWTGRRDCTHTTTGTQFLTSFALKVERSQGRGDDTAMNNIRFRCRALGAGGQGYSLEGSGGPWGGWGGWSGDCPSGSAICGIAVRFEGRQGKGDDTALNDVMVYCCND